MAGSALIVVLVLAEFGFNLSDLLGAAAATPARASAFLEPGLKYGVTHDLADRLPLPRPRAGARHRRPAAHPDPLLHRPDRAGRPQVGAVGDRPDRHLLPLHAGARLRCRGAARHATRYDQVAASGGNLASPLLAEAVGGGDGSTGGAVLLAVIAAVAFATILAVVAGLTLTSSVVGGARPLQQRLQEGGGVGEEEEMRVARDRGRRHRRWSRSCWPSRRRSSTSPSWWRWPSRSRPRRTCRRSSTTCSGGGSTPAAPTWSIYGGLISAVGLVIFSPGHVRRASRAPARTCRCCRQDRHLVPAGEPGHRLDPARLLPRLARHDHVERSRRPRSATPSSRSAPSPAPAPRAPSRTDRSATGQRGTPAPISGGGSAAVRPVTSQAGPVTTRTAGGRDMRRPSSFTSTADVRTQEKSWPTRPWRT